MDHSPFWEGNIFSASQEILIVLNQEACHFSLSSAKFIYPRTMIEFS